LILFFVTGTIWTPFYNLICFLKLKQLATQINKPKLNNSPILNFLLCLTIIGIPFVLYNRYKKLHSYILSQDTKTKQVDDETINCSPPINFIMFVISTFLIFGLFVTSIVIPSLIIAGVKTWNSALLVLFPIGCACLFTSVGFSGRLIKEEKKWVEVFNSI
jgi:hypothetical protein